jgi:NAD(P)-dependent dehydrogenase (short-subunit alcohol dehydrogenase family)
VGDPLRLLAVAGDLTDEAARVRLVGAIGARFGRLDVLVHNAGITHRSPAKRTDPAVIRRVMEVNYHLPVALTALALPLLRTSRGSLVCIGSMAGWMPVPGRAGYGASKAALAQYFEVLRQELVADGVHVLMAYPSFLDTPIERNALGADGGAAPHARSTVGRIRSAPWQAARIVAALEARRAEVPREWLPAFGGWLWATWPALHRRLMARRFGGELG